MATLFIADLHLSRNHTNTAEIFLKFLENEARQADALYILGDLFDYWIGDDNLTPFNQKIISGLKALTNTGVPVFIMHGNRDFLLGKHFMKATGCKLIKDPTVITLYGIPVLLMHGDTLCTKDTKYISFRKKIRHPITKRLFLWKSLKKRENIAQNLRKASMQSIQKLSKEKMDATPEEIKRVMALYKTDYLIHGHTHRPTIDEFHTSKKTYTRVVLASWNDEGSVLVCSLSPDQKSLKLTLKAI